MLPLYKQTMRFVSDPYVRMKKQAVVGVAMVLALLFVFFLAFSSDSSTAPVGVPAPTPATAPKQQHPPPLPARATEATIPAAVADARGRLPRPPVYVDSDKRHDGAHAQEPPVLDDAPGAVMRGGATATTTAPPVPAPPTHLPWFVRLVLPLVAGYCFGFLGSVPIAGPTSAMVLKLGIQGKYQSALTIAVGGAISEATYAGIAFWGFGSFLAGAKFLLPVSKVLGAVMFTAVGVVFLRSEMKPSMASDHDGAPRKGTVSGSRDEVYRNILLGVTMSGINPALLATYTGAIASVYGTGMLEFNLFLALVFGVGVCSGVSSWFYLLLSLLKKYKQRLKDQTIGRIMRGMGCFLLTLGLLCAKSSVEYFVWGPPPAADTHQ